MTYKVKFKLDEYELRPLNEQYDHAEHGCDMLSALRKAIATFRKDNGVDDLEFYLNYMMPEMARAVIFKKYRNAIHRIFTNGYTNDGDLHNQITKGLTMLRNADIEIDLKDRPDIEITVQLAFERADHAVRFKLEVLGSDNQLDDAA